MQALTLEQKTLVYWITSKGFNIPENPDAPTTSISTVIRDVTNLSYELGPQRQLLRNNVLKLRDCLIKHGRKPSKLSKPSKSFKNSADNVQLKLHSLARIGEVFIDYNNSLPDILISANKGSSND